MAEADEKHFVEKNRMPLLLEVTRKLYLSLNVEEMFVTGRPTYPAERTLLSTGILAAAMDSRHEGHRRIETPWLDICYRRDMDVPYIPQGPRPTGACVAPWPPES